MLPKGALWGAVVSALALIVGGGTAFYLLWPERIGQFGYFVGRVEASWSDDGRTMQLLQPLTYVDPAGRVWTAPERCTIDGASIPRAFWSVIGGPFEGAYRSASVIHDAACQMRDQPWEDVHLMFYHACRCAGVTEKKAKIMYMAVYHFGPRWPPKGELPDRHPVMALRTEIDEKNAKKWAEFVEQKNPSLEEIRDMSLFDPADILGP